MLGLHRTYESFDHHPFFYSKMSHLANCALGGKPGSEWQKYLREWNMYIWSWNLYREFLQLCAQSCNASPVCRQSLRAQNFERRKKIDIFFLRFPSNGNKSPVTIPGFFSDWKSHNLLSCWCVIDTNKGREQSSSYTFWISYSYTSKRSNSYTSKSSISYTWI